MATIVDCGSFGSVLGQVVKDAEREWAEMSEEQRDLRYYENEAFEACEAYCWVRADGCWVPEEDIEEPDHLTYEEKLDLGRWLRAQERKQDVTEWVDPRTDPEQILRFLK